ncbi:hypothetical protein FT643_09525 [Ketobacter sp. MCCC 1A13808]|uniref:hypothetical protein n=1 Tax=Ketobacter sp. MCCC 1A13808 TaxID=2602738 RepID=UPI0012EC4095|nr:hypothetical protein [Ketobacter sp. MCCC 1A13808]MVF12381.1 hypothetical protein [Ketobacter sp. MCCC 1A13808]
MKRILGGLMVVLCAVAHAEDQLHVTANQDYTLPSGTQELMLKQLILDDGATLRVPAGMERLQISAEKARIGKQVKIIASGANGKAGADGKNQGGQAATCAEGAQGGDGQPGAAGADGAAITLLLSIEQLGSLQVDTRGGAGGNGGNGGSGQQAGAFDVCSAPDGGAGGAAGNGGRGGNGGDVRIYYNLLPSSGLSGSISQRIEVDAAAGNGAAPGQPGKGGEGSDGKYINMRTLSGNKKWKAGGDEGKEGASGQPGAAGSKGAVDILKGGFVAGAVTQTRPVPPKPDQSLDDLRRAVQSQSEQLEQVSTKMNQTMEALDVRIKQLEKQVKGLPDR